jgi:predicted exporter
VFAAGVVLASLGIWGAVRLEMGQDVTELMPSLDERDRAALDVLERSSLFDALYVELSGAEPGALASAARELAGVLLEDPRVEAVESMVTAEQERRAARLLFEHRFHLLAPDTPGLRDALDPRKVREALELTRARMLSPVPGASRRAARDPLDLASLAGRRIEGSLASSRIRMYEGIAFTPDLDRCLLALRTDVPALKVDDAGDLVDDVRAAAARVAGGVGVAFRVSGAHVFSSESARTVKSDVTRAFLLAGVGIALLFFFYFRRPTFLLMGLLPSAAGVLAGFAVSSLVWGRVSGIAVGFGSIVVGISVDYSIHFLRERLAWADGRAAGAEAAALSMRAVAPSLLAGFGTTVVVFAFYGASDFPLIRELGLFAGSGVVAGFAVSTLVLPLLPVRGRGRGSAYSVPGRLLSPGRVIASIVVACVLAPAALMGTFIPRLRMEDDVRKLDYQDPRTAAFAEQLERRWLGPRRGRVVIARGETVQEALERSDAAIRILEAHALPFTSPSQVLPSVRTQEQNLAAILARDWTDLRERIEEEADELGFAEGAFEPFFEDLRRARRGTTRPLVPRDLAGTPMGHLLAGAVVEGGTESAVLTFLPGRDRGAEAIRRIEREVPRTIVTSRVRIMNDVFEAVRTEVMRLIMLALLGILLVLLVRYRRVRPALLAIIPVLVACVTTAGAFALAGVTVNAIAVLAFTLIVGVGLDYGIFMVDALERGPGASHTVGAVLVSGLTTLVSFGVLTTCRNPVLRSTGLVVLVGVVTSLVAAILLVPSLSALVRGKGARR